jgi:hypothetical protein
MRGLPPTAHSTGQARTTGPLNPVTQGPASSNPTAIQGPRLLLTAVCNSAQRLHSSITTRTNIVLSLSWLFLIPLPSPLQNLYPFPTSPSPLGSGRDPPVPVAFPDLGFIIPIWHSLAVMKTGWPRQRPTSMGLWLEGEHGARDVTCKLGWPAM